MPAVILSPHLDDAVLSCWHLLTGPDEVTVINVFAGVPEGRTEPAWWDAMTGATDSAARVRERLAEDRDALALAGRAAINLPFLDEQYRASAPSPDALRRRVLAHLVPGARLYTPAAFGAIADHALVRTVGLGLRDAGFDVCLYADLPHAVRTGEPAWSNGNGLGVLAGTGARPAPDVIRLSAAAHAGKLAAVGRYATQLPGLEAYVGRPLSDPAVLGVEVIWPTRAPARPEARPAAHR